VARLGDAYEEMTDAGLSAGNNLHLEIKGAGELEPTLKLRSA